MIGRSRTLRQLGGERAQDPSGLAPRSIHQDEPHAHSSESGWRETIANEVGAALLVVEPAGKQFRSYLDDEAKLTDVEVASWPEADLDVPGPGRAGPWFFGTVHRLGDEVGKELGETAQLIIRHIVRVHDIDERHDVILSAERPVCGPGVWWHLSDRMLCFERLRDAPVTGILLG